MAGFLPGLLSALMFAAMIIIRVKLNPKLAPPVDDTVSSAEKLAALREIWPLPVLIIGVLVGIFAGFFTPTRSEEHTSELQSLMRISYAVFCLKKKHQHKHNTNELR